MALRHSRKYYGLTDRDCTDGTVVLGLNQASFGITGSDSEIHSSRLEKVGQRDS